MTRSTYAHARESDCDTDNPLFDLTKDEASILISMKIVQLVRSYAISFTCVFHVFMRFIDFSLLLAALL